MLPLILTNLLIFAIRNSEQYEGDPCLIENSQGVCTNLQQCPAVVKKLINNGISPTICGFSEFDSLVCCLKETSTTAAQITQWTTSKNWNPFLDEASGGTTPKNTNPFLFPNKLETKSTEQSTATSRTVPNLINPFLFPTTTTPRSVSNRSSIVDRSVGSRAREKCLEHSPAIKPEECYNYRAFVVGGVKSASKTHPHMAAIGFDGKLGGAEGVQWLCGGSLVSEQFVLTAAHCLHSPSWGNPIRVRVGDLNLARTDDDARPQERNIVQRIKHPEYKPPAAYHDIALLKLDDPVKFDEYVKLACLPYNTEEIGVYLFTATATGWGLLDWTDDKGSDDLMEVTLNFVPQSECNSKYSDGQVDSKLTLGVVDDWQICAGEIGKDTCQGDSGGPLTIYNLNNICLNTVIGITSVGRLCGSFIPGIYTRVSHYIDWIENIVWPEP